AVGAGRRERHPRRCICCAPGHRARMRRAVVVPIAAVALAAQDAAVRPDFLIDPRPYVAKVEAAADASELVLDNGLLRATLRLQPDAALVSLRVGGEGRELLRAVRPFGKVTLDGKEFALGGLLGQPNQAFLLPEWLGAMTRDPDAFHFDRWQQ